MPVYRYQIYGVPWESDAPLPGLAVFSGRGARGGEGVRFRVNGVRWGAGPSPRAAPRGVLCGWERRGGAFLLGLPTVGRFRIDPVRKVIGWEPAPGGSPELAGRYASRKMAGLMMHYLRPCLVLHASFVAVRGKAVGFLGPSGRGKSSLSAGFMREGFPLLCDDVGVIQGSVGRWAVQPGPAEIRLGPRAARRLCAGAFRPGLRAAGEITEKLVLDKEAGLTFHARPKPLGALYLLSRQPGRRGARVTRLSEKKALAALLSGAWGRLLEDPPVLVRQFQVAERIVREIPVKLLAYPSDLGALPDVCGAVLRDREKDS